MSEKKARAGERGRRRGTPGARPPLDGVVLVSVGQARGQAPVEGVQMAHVARIHDLPSLIHSLTAGGSEL